MSITLFDLFQRCFQICRSEFSPIQISKIRWHYVFIFLYCAITTMHISLKLVVYQLNSGRISSNLSFSFVPQNMMISIIWFPITTRFTTQTLFFSKWRDFLSNITLIHVITTSRDFSKCHEKDCVSTRSFVRVSWNICFIQRY